MQLSRSPFAQKEKIIPVAVSPEWNDAEKNEVKATIDSYIKLIREMVKEMKPYVSHTPPFFGEADRSIQEAERLKEILDTASTSFLEHNRINFRPFVANR